MAGPNLVYVNGTIVPRDEATISVEDRGFNFADGIYEVVRIAGGRPFRIEAHLDRLQGGARTLEIDLPLDRDALREAVLEVARANELEEGTIYVQLTRGVAPRQHAFPRGVRPTLVMLAKDSAGPPVESLERGVAVVTAPDLRWGYCEVKTIGLLPNVIAYQHARSDGCHEALLVRRGVVTEGSHSSAFCVRDGTVYTHPIDNILPSITRRYLVESLRGDGFEVKEEAVALEEFRVADEIFLTGTTTEVLGVVTIDGAEIGSGEVGPVTRRGLELYRRDLEACRSGAAG